MQPNWKADWKRITISLLPILVMHQL
jgi:hypothetical protein